MNIPGLSNPFQKIFPITVDEALGSPRGRYGEVSQGVLEEFKKGHQTTAACGAELQRFSIHGPWVRIRGCVEKLESLRSEGFEGTRVTFYR
jgi:hypothetical protein